MNKELEALKTINKNKIIGLMKYRGLYEKETGFNISQDGYIHAYINWMERRRTKLQDHLLEVYRAVNNE